MEETIRCFYQDFNHASAPKREEIVIDVIKYFKGNVKNTYSVSEIMTLLKCIINDYNSAKNFGSWDGFSKRLFEKGMWQAAHNYLKN